MTDSQQTIYIVDDDQSVLIAMRTLLEAKGYAVLCFLDPMDFLEIYHADLGGCLLLDIQMPSMSGLSLQDELVAIGARLPVIIITGHADVPSAVTALKAGAFEFFQKPCDSDKLLVAVEQALKLDRRRRRKLAEEKSIIEKISELTGREREVLSYLIDGHTSKFISIDLGISQRTVDIYRSNVMLKMRARTLVELINMTNKVPAKILTASDS